MRPRKRERILKFRMLSSQGKGTTTVGLIVRARITAARIGIDAPSHIDVIAGIEKRVSYARHARLRLRGELKALRVYRGLYARVARTLGLDISHVTRVANGQRTSRRVSEAIANEARRMKEEAAA